MWIIVSLYVNAALPLHKRSASICVSDCNGMQNGDYQSCLSCDVYLTCSNGLTYDNRPCPADLVWDDNLKRCEWTSSTCGHASDDGEHYRIARLRLPVLGQ